MTSPQETCPVRGTGSPENPEVAALIEQFAQLQVQFDAFNVRTALLTRECEKWKREARWVRDPKAKQRLIAQSRQFQERYQAMAMEHDHLQQANARLQARAAAVQEDPHATQSS